MKNFTYLLLCILSLFLMIGSVSAFWENMTSSMGTSYEDVFKTPDLTKAWSNYYDDPFEAPSFGSTNWDSYEDAFKTPELTHAWSYYYDDPFYTPF